MPLFPAYSFVFTDVEELDICNESAVQCFLDNEKPTFVINCAAYTAVDKAESDVDNAYRLNRDAAGFLAQACRNSGAFFIHVSTDYIFDGTAQSPYKPDDPANPMSVYGSSKREGEQRVIETGGPAMIVRTSWLYSAYGNNFVKTMLRLGRERGEVRVVRDQQGCPTNAADLALALLSAIDGLRGKQGVQIHHFANQGATTWFDFAQAIFEISGIPCKVIPVTSAEFPTPVKRPAYSVLDTSSFVQTFQQQIPSWRDSLKRCLLELQSQENN